MKETETDAGRLRAEQVSCFIDGDFTRYFTVSERLAAASSGFARSYEYWTHTVLHTLAASVADARVLQVGGMDGKRFDPVHAFIRHYGWHSVILEPLPDLFAALAETYRDCSDVTLVNAALVAADGPATMTRVDRDAALSGAVPLWAEGLGTFHPERNALGGVGVTPELHAALLGAARRETVAGLTLRTLGERHGLDRIDLLQVDAEGCELDILRQVDAAGRRPAAVHLEYWALPHDERRELIGLLAGWGHALRMGESDVMAVSPELRAAVDAAVGWSC